VAQARDGDLNALDALLRELQGPVFNLALRMLGQREDAQDATQEVLLKVTTHLATWKGDSAFGTWVFSVASHHLLNQRARRPQRHEVSFGQLADQLDEGLAYAERIGYGARAQTPEDHLEARRTALSCTQAMLMCLDPPGRMAYVLDVIFGLESAAAAQVQGISAAAHRQRLARARSSVHSFMGQRCGLVSDAAPCRCAKQVPGKRAAAARGLLPPGLQVHDTELDAAERGLRELTAMGDAASVMRGSPQFAPPAEMVNGIRLVVQQSWFLQQ
jgi:RNA polymerase sigma factor (sigma-70 family)